MIIPIGLNRFYLGMIPNKKNQNYKRQSHISFPIEPSRSCLGIILNEGNQNLERSETDTISSKNAYGSRISEWNLSHRSELTNHEARVRNRDPNHKA